MLLLDGKKTAADIRQELHKALIPLASQAGRAPGLAVLLVGDNPASQVYVRNKERACAEAGIVSRTLRLPAETSQESLEKTIQTLNDDNEIDGILVQLPLPEGLDSARCLECIAPEKDVDGFHPSNIGRLTLGLPALRPCTPAGVMTLLSRYDINPAGQHVVILGRSNIVGKPQALLMLQANATVSICHSRTRDLAVLTRQADILVAAVGRPAFVQADMVRHGAIVIDVGINRTPDGLCGDCDFTALAPKVKAITPVPGGIGPMTIATLLQNTVAAYRTHVG